MAGPGVSAMAPVGCVVVSGALSQIAGVGEHFLVEIFQDEWELAQWKAMGREMFHAQGTAGHPTY